MTPDEIKAQAEDICYKSRTEGSVYGEAVPWLVDINRRIREELGYSENDVDNSLKIDEYLALGIKQGIADALSGLGHGA